MRKLLITAVLILSVLPARAGTSEVLPADESFTYAWLKGYARSMAESPSGGPREALPKELQGMSWDEYQQIRFKKEKAYWRDTASPFRMELFHLGLYYHTPVSLFLLEDGKAFPIGYSSSLFTYGSSGVQADHLPDDLGFAGFRMSFHTDWQRDVIAFLGASYFRAVGREMQYGLSARGLAVDAGLPRSEEFPVFTHFWLQRPKPGNAVATVYALLDSASVCGAYRFDIRPGVLMKMNVDVALYPRRAIERLGIAPLTSMYLIGENDRGTDADWRPEIHDSDGLLMHTGNDEWLWRPLNNPPQLRFNAFVDDNPRGFGLLQRDRNFDHYQDDGVFYDRRPGLWIEPLGDWGEGAINLLEIPTEDETFDNIVAFWNPRQPVEPGKEYLFSYNMYWGSFLPKKSNRAGTVATFTGLGGVVGRKREYYSRRFVIDFAGGLLPMLGKNTKVEPVITSSAGRIEIASAREQKAIDGYRVRFDLVPPANGDEPINLRVLLANEGMPLTETWIYQWTPPPLE